MKVCGIRLYFAHLLDDIPGCFKNMLKIQINLKLFSLPAAFIFKENH